jgi:hypothetical protein
MIAVPQTFVKFTGLTGPAFIRADQVALVRVDPADTERTLVVLQSGHEVLVRQRAADVATTLFNPHPGAPA